MKIFAAGISTETNTFAPQPTQLADFQVVRGSDFSSHSVECPSLDLAATWGVGARALGAQLVVSLNAWAQPSGITERCAYESLRDEMLRDLLAAQPVDIVLLNLHGAMVADGFDDCEADLLHRVRAIVGERVVVAALFDLHCHLTPLMIALADLVVTLKEYPHVDVSERAMELFDLAVATHLGMIRPVMAMFDCRMLGLYPTTRQPLRGLVDAMRAATRRERVLSVSFAHSFQFADVPRAGARVLAIADGDHGLARETAREFGMAVYRMRRQIGFDSFSLPIDAAFEQALASTRPPAVVADQSDNVGAGAPGDSTFALRWLLEHRVESAALAILHDSAAVESARHASFGATLRLSLGGKSGSWSGEAVDVEARVGAVREGYVHAFPQQSGPPTLWPAGDVAALTCGGIDVVVSSRRCQCFAPSIFKDLGIDPRSKRLLVVKSTQHFHRAFAPLAADVVYMTAPGAVPPDPRVLSHKRLDAGTLYPWCKDPLCADDADARARPREAE